MDHIFISYSHKDTEYAHALADSLQSRGFPGWVDARLDYGSQWPQEIQKYLDACEAFILIMSPRSFESVVSRRGAAQDPRRAGCSEWERRPCPNEFDQL